MIIPRKPVIDKDKCVNCGICIANCPKLVFSKGDKPVVDEKKCTGCKACEAMCPIGCIEVLDVKN